MCDRSIRRLTRNAVTLALAAVITSACDGPGMVPPLGPPPKPQSTQTQPSAAAVSPPRPSTACTSERFTIDAAEGGPPWVSLCVKTGTEMRVENLGTDGFSTTPAG